MSLIESTPGICGGVARISGTRIPVWIIIECCYTFGLTPDEIIGCYPRLSEDDIEIACDYYGEHKAEIDLEIELNQEA